jgi:uncharacterized protein (DUF952 family)
LIYKILLPDEWAGFEAAGRFDGSPFDHSSGFIHCSSRAQVATVARALFGSQPALVVIAIDDAALGDAVRWERSPDGSVFPHVYAPVPLDAVVSVHRVAGASSVDDTLGAP